MSLLINILIGLEVLDLPKWLARSILLVLAVSFVGVLGLHAVDRLAWRLSETYVPGLRKQQRDEAMQASPLWRSLGKVGKTYQKVNDALIVGITVLFVVALVLSLMLELTNSTDAWR